MADARQSDSQLEPWRIFVGEFTRVIPGVYEPSGKPAQLCVNLLSIGELCAAWNWLVRTNAVPHEKRYGDDPAWGIDANWLGYRVLRLADDELPPYLDVGDPASSEFRESASSTMRWAEAAFERWKTAGAPTESAAERTSHSNEALEQWAARREVLAGHGVSLEERMNRRSRAMDYGNGRVECPRCEGRGFFPEFSYRDEGRCYLCFGRRWVWANREYRSF
jgi:hypothetical protein